MKVLFISAENDPGDWQSVLQNLLPGLELCVWPEGVDDKADFEIALVWKPPPGVLKQFPNLKLIQCLGMGVDALFADPELPEHAVIARLIDRNLIAQMSEYICWAVLHHHRLMDTYAVYQAERRWRQLPPPDTARRRIGILGLGTIGRDVASKLQVLGFPVQGWSRSGVNAPAGIDMFAGAEGLQPFLQTSNVLVCLLPLTPQTQGIIDADLLQQLPKDAYLINVARGGHVVDADLLAALDRGHLAGATLDVVNQEPLPSGHPYWRHPKIHLTPHIAGLTTAASAAAQIAANIRRALAGREILNRVEPARQY